MRINNPKSFAGFTVADTSKEGEYKLATIGQVKNAISAINTKFDTLLRGSAANGALGDPGYSFMKGYAWLNGDGKVDASLLPSLAITETHVITQSELGNYVEDYEIGSYAKNVYALLNTWINAVANPSGDAKPEVFQKGDIIIVTPDETVSENTTQSAATPESRVESSMQVEADTSKIANPNFCGTYIITDIRGVAGGNEYTFAKMAYTDSHIVSINGLVPGNSTGTLLIHLKDILKTKEYIAKYTSGGFATSADAAAHLEETVYRLGRLADGENGYRFAFIDNTVDGEAVIVPYARKRELDEEIDQRKIAISGLNEALEQLRSYADFNTSGIVNDIDEIKNTIGTLSSDTNRALTGTLRAQLAALRADVDFNAELLDSVRADTNLLVSKLQDNIDSIYNAVNEKAVTIIEKQIIWGEAGVSRVQEIESATPALFSEDPLMPASSGSLLWTYDYYAPTDMTTETVDAANPSKAYKNGPTSDEKILAVYDAEGNEVGVDLQKKTSQSGPYTQISVITENYGKENGSYINSLVGQEWTLLIAKRIIGISKVDPGDISSYTPTYPSIAVGGTEPAAKTPEVIEP